MKKIFIFLVILLCSSLISGEILEADRNEIENQLKIIEGSLNKRDINSILNLIPDEEDKNEIRETLTEFFEENKETENINFQFGRIFIDELDSNHAFVDSRWSAKGKGWEIGSRVASYMFKKNDSSWEIASTDLHTDLLQVSRTNKQTRKIERPIIIAIVLFWVFSLWMLYDIFTRKNIKNKWLWVVLIILFGLIGAIIYFFVERRRAIKELERKP